MPKVKGPAPKKILGRLREVRVHMGQFDFTIWTVCGPLADVKRYVEWRLDCVLVDEATEVDGLCFEGTPGRGPIIWLPRIPRTADDIGSLAHEACHAVRDMMGDWAGMQLNKDSDEVLCHGIGHVVKTVLSEFRGR